ncbi:hypothetical protein EAE96_007698 [Botrytis aclada]|nr:hypothetical protein EAE96_007698 [Botrytis aclada]
MYHGLSQANKPPTAAVNASIRQASLKQVAPPLNCAVTALPMLVPLALATAAVVAMLVPADEVVLAPLPPLALELNDVLTAVVVKLPVGTKYPLLIVVVAFAPLYGGRPFPLDPEINPGCESTTTCESTALEYPTVSSAPPGNE